MLGRGPSGSLLLSLDDETLRVGVEEFNGQLEQNQCCLEGGKDFLNVVGVRFANDPRNLLFT